MSELRPSATSERSRFIAALGPHVSPHPRPFFAETIVVREQLSRSVPHVNNVEYVRWMQDVAKAHAEACGGAAAVRALGATWVVRSHHIEYLKPLLEGDQVIIRTWVERLDRASSIRCYELRLAASKTLAARGETKWVLIDLQSGRPRAVTDLLVLVHAEPERRAREERRARDGESQR